MESNEYIEELRRIYESALERGEVGKARDLLERIRQEEWEADKANRSIDEVIEMLKDVFKRAEERTPDE